MKKFPLHLDGKLSKISKSSKSHNLISRKSVPSFRSSRLQMFFKVNILKSYAVATKNQLRWSSSSPPALKLYKKNYKRCFPVNIPKELRTIFFIEDLRDRLCPLSLLFEIITEKNVQLFCLHQPIQRSNLMHVLKLIPEKVDQGV